ncbi:MAG: hypothetical protein A2033_01445 [Bacteroidetes bacterium GWA2_31_9]|nr:MAG: hypothetical protein A2033_01445 [Bacteroidetes bacterium GWA2_31_9]
MKHLGVLILFIAFCFNLKAQKSVTACLSKDEKNLYDLIMAYRKQNKLPVIPISKSLTFVAQTHCKDLSENKPDNVTGCNPHSWSNKGEWTACCYTSDHKQAQCMWDKPRELTNYKGNGYEIAFGSSDSRYDDYTASSESALDAWKKSSGHNNVILNKDIWKSQGWGAIGVAIYKGYSVVWFGEEADEDGSIDECEISKN